MDPETLIHLASEELGSSGILLESDPRLPSFVGIAIGGRPKGSWWGIKEGRMIFAAVTAFSKERYVMSTKLVSGKTTFVHSNLWPEILAIGKSREEWQTYGLSRGGRELLKLVEKRGLIATDEVTGLTDPVPAAALELERRLLLYSEQFHSRKGLHAKRLESWKSWSGRKNESRRQPSPNAARLTLERTVESLNRKYDGKGRLPWE